MITKEEIESKKTELGGWTKQQLSEWGVPWPLKKGWKEKLINRQLPVASRALEK